MAELLSSLLFDAARARPEHPAVCYEKTSFTYRQLAARAGQLAAELRDAGVARGDRVGLFAPKSCETVGAAYGVMWSGGAYVPLDVGAPPPRVGYMIRNCAMKALVTRANQAARLVGQLGGHSLQRIILLDEQADTSGLSQKLEVPVVTWAQVGGRTPRAEPAPLSAHELAYILYTSGSTGEPKGVMISHRNALAFVEWSLETVGVTRDDRLSSHAPFHFDLSVFDLYVAALAQATVSIVPDGVTMFPATLAEWIERDGITTWYSVPSVLVQMMDRGQIDRFAFARLRNMCFAGEVFATKYLRAWMQKLPRARWFNLYGPTETNVCTYYEVPSPPAGDDPISIGVGSSGDDIYLVDEAGKVLEAVGEVGEIWVDGPTVALGYWGDAAKTAERFTPAPHITGDAARKIYRTGDLAHWDAERKLIFKGRRDHMIKSRGYRIELGDIEAAAYKHGAVQEACAVALPDLQIGNRIRLCVTVHSGQQLDKDALERHLLSHVPRYMIPGEVEFLPALPKTSTGKIDRRALTQAALASSPA